MDEFHLGLNLNRIKMLKYEVTRTSTAENPPPEARWEVILKIMKKGKGIYTMERTSIFPNWTAAGLNATFTIDNKAYISDVVAVETRYGYNMSETGEWVNVKINQTFNGSGFYQEILPLPGKTILIGDSWNGTFHSTGVTEFRGETMNSSMTSVHNGTIWCEAVSRKNIQTQAGSFSVIEVKSRTKSVIRTVIGDRTRTTRGGPYNVSIEGIYMIDVETGIVVSATSVMVEESTPHLIHQTIIELLEVVQK